MSDTLLLNASGQPVSVLPLSTIGWQEAIRTMVLEKADVLAWHEGWFVHSPTWTTQVPSVIMLREYQKAKTSVRFSRANIYLRDGGKCQYCGTSLDKKEATLDHVLPTSKGGKTTWENSVTACFPCNAAKADKVGHKPRVKPYKPEYFELVNKRKKFPFVVKHDEWLQYIL